MHPWPVFTDATDALQHRPKKMRIHLFFISLLSLYSAYINRQITICDLKTQHPIPFTTIRSIDFKVGGYTDSSGRFELTDEFSDSLVISSIGYVDRKISQKQLSGDTIYLEPFTTELSTVTVRHSKHVGEMTIGITKGNRSEIWGSSGFGDEFAQKIYLPDTGKVYKIKTVAIGMERFDETIPMLLHIYHCGTDKLPGKDILSSKVLLRRDGFDKRKKKMVIDIASQNIFLHESACFVGVEWLPVQARGRRLPTSALLLTDDIETELTYSRAFYYNKDKWSNTLRTPGQASPNNTLISIQVDVLD